MARNLVRTLSIAAPAVAVPPPAAGLYMRLFEGTLGKFYVGSGPVFGPAHAISCSSKELRLLTSDAAGGWVFYVGPSGSLAYDGIDYSRWTFCTHAELQEFDIRSIVIFDQAKARPKPPDPVVYGETRQPTDSRSLTLANLLEDAYAYSRRRKEIAAAERVALFERHFSPEQFFTSAELAEFAAERAIMNHRMQAQGGSPNYDALDSELRPR